MSGRSVLAWLGATCLAAVLAAGAAAHTQIGALGPAASATDYYQVTCSNDGTGPPQSLLLELRDEGPQGGPLLSVQVFRNGELANATDPDDTDLDFGPLIWVNGGGGVYHVLVDKSGAGAENYRLSYHCVTGPNGTGQHTGTSTSVRQNQ